MANLVVLGASPTLSVAQTNSLGFVAGEPFQLAFTNTPGAGFTVLAATNLSLALSNWAVVGNAIEFSPGQYQFTDLQTTNSPQLFYRVRSP